MYNLERRLRYSQLLTKYCLCNLFQLNLNQNKTNCSKNIISDGICVREMSPWPECNYFSQFAAISGLVIVKNVLISFIKECRELTLMPPCDVITMKNTLSGIIWDDFFISQVKLSSVFNILTFLKWPPFWGRDKLFYRKWYRKLFEFLIDALAELLMEVYQFQNLTTIDVTSAWNITCTTVDIAKYVPQNIVCVAPVFHS